MRETISCSFFSYGLEHFPQKWVRFCGQKILQVFKLGPFLSDLIDSIRSERALAAALLLGMLGLTSTQAAEPVRTKPCDAAPYHQFDFWLGDWRVYDGTNGQLVAKDHIELQFEGCVVQQTLTFVTDMYRKPGVAYRLAGASTSRFDGQQWLQLWVDNQWGAIIMKGAPAKDGDMVLDTVIPSRGRDVRLIWKRQPGGVVRILQYVADTGSGKWEQYGDLIYRPEPAKAPHQASSGASTP